MKVLKLGKVPKKIFHMTCLNCKSELEGEEQDRKSEPCIEHGSRYFFWCPVDGCETKIYHFKELQTTDY